MGAGPSYSLTTWYYCIIRSTTYGVHHFTRRSLGVLCVVWCRNTRITSRVPGRQTSHNTSMYEHRKEQNNRGNHGPSRSVVQARQGWMRAVLCTNLDREYVTDPEQGGPRCSVTQEREKRCQLVPSLGPRGDDTSIFVISILYHMLPIIIHKTSYIQHHMVLVPQDVRRSTPWVSYEYSYIYTFGILLYE